jgi:hypothetical protein
MEKQENDIQEIFESIQQRLSILQSYYKVKAVDRLKIEIINTGFPLFVVRVGICEKPEQSKMYKELFDIKQEHNDSTFYQDFELEGLYIGIQLNTIFDYVDMNTYNKLI